MLRNVTVPLTQRFPNFSASVIWGLVIISWASGDCPVNCGFFFFLPASVTTASNSCNNQKYLHTLPKILWGMGQDHSLLGIALFTFSEMSTKIIFSHFLTPPPKVGNANSLSLLPVYRLDDTEIKQLAQGHLAGSQDGYAPSLVLD